MSLGRRKLIWVKLSIFVFDFKQSFVSLDRFSWKSPIPNFKEIRPVWAALIHMDRRTNRRMEMTKRIDAVPDYANASRYNKLQFIGALGRAAQTFPVFSSPNFIYRRTIVLRWGTEDSPRPLTTKDNTRTQKTQICYTVSVSGLIPVLEQYITFQS